MAANTHRLLLIAYQFPPVGGAGVQRVAKFTKYLPEQGWDVSVLTVSNPSVPLVDRSLVAEIPPQTIIRQARSLEPGYRVKQTLAQTSPEDTRRSRWMTKAKQTVRGAATMLLQPDPQILWAPQAIREGRRLLREVPHDAILVSGPPFSSFLVGVALRSASGLPLILDYRDEWSISNRYWENKSRNPLVQSLQRRQQRWAIRHADMLLATTEQSARTLEEEARGLDREIPVRCLYNGFDAADFSTCVSPASERDSARYRLSHVGTLWQLTTAAPLVRAVERLTDRNPQLAARLEVEVIGRCTASEESMIQRLAGLPCNLLRQEYIDHNAAVRVMQGTDDLCLLLADLPGAERVVPGKTFEYLATGRRILAITPDGELRRLLSGFAGVSVYAPTEIRGICEYLARRISRPESATSYARDVIRFDRRHQVGELAGLLRRVARARGSSTEHQSPLAAEPA